MASRAATAGTVRRRTAQRSNVRWDRVARAALFGLIGVIALLYISGGIGAFEAWRQNAAATASLARLEREHARLLREHKTLSSRSTIEAEALKMGMTHPGEQQYLVTGLPSN